MNYLQMCSQLDHWLDQQAVTSEKIESIRRQLLMPFECAWNAYVRDATTARENMVRFLIPQTRLNGLAYGAYVALLANGGLSFDQRLCECDASVGMCPCRYCAIHESLTSFLRALGLQPKETP